MKKFILSTGYLLLSAFLLSTLYGCVTTHAVSFPGSKYTVMLDGAAYTSANVLRQRYDLDYYWDPFVRKAMFKKDDVEVKMLAGSRFALVNDTVQTMENEARIYQGEIAIPQVFVYKTLAPLFTKKRIQVKTPAPQISGRPIKTVIIDAGHGGKDPGAIGRNGLKEKDVVLDIAKRLKARLQTMGVRVIMTRESDIFLSLYQRYRIANTQAADFFISIHANASRSRWVSGVEVFYLSDSVDDSQRSLRAAKNYNLQLQEKYSGNNTAVILWDLMLSDNRISSQELADCVCYALSRKLSQRNRGTKPARFYVLKTNIPAILVEVGFISNLREEKRLRYSSYREDIAQTIAEGIMQYNYNLGKTSTARY